MFVKGAAEGELYVDDGHSFSYRDTKAFCLRSFRMQSGRLTCWSVATAGSTAAPGLQHKSSPH